MEGTVSNKKVALNGISLALNVAVLVFLAGEAAGLWQSLWVYRIMFSAYCIFTAFLRTKQWMLTKDDTVNDSGLNAFRLVVNGAIMLTLLLLVGRLVF